MSSKGKFLMLFSDQEDSKQKQENSMTLDILEKVQ